MHKTTYEKRIFSTRIPACAQAADLQKEIANLFGKTKQDGYSPVPLSVYLKSSRVKLELGLCRGKKRTISATALPCGNKREMDRAIEEAQSLNIRICGYTYMGP